MKYLRALLLVVGIAGAILTAPAPSLLFTAGGIVFGLIFLSFLGLTWFAWGLGKPKEASGTPQSTQAGSEGVRC
jgi:hypothetical protein